MALRPGLFSHAQHAGDVSSLPSESHVWEGVHPRRIQQGIGYVTVRDTGRSPDTDGVISDIVQNSSTV